MERVNARHRPRTTSSPLGGDTGTTPAEGIGMNLDDLLSTTPPPFALLHRPQSGEGDELDVLVGEVSTVEHLADLPVDARARTPGGTGAVDHELLAVVPYRQLTERGFACHDDGTPILAMTVTDQRRLGLTEALGWLPDMPITLADAGFDIDDAAYAATVRDTLTHEIGQGAGSNFVIKRAFTGTIPQYSPRAALALFRRLLVSELGAYWTFVVHTGQRTFVGASPERHVSLAEGTVVMNPISGTYRYPPSGPDMTELLAFLRDRKEADELYMVVDEELKMMARICDSGGCVVGPDLKEMAQLAHTEYFLEGYSSRDVRELLRETMFAPTVTGSPLENACRVLARREPAGRGYYSGALALVGRDPAGHRALDSTILIRSADIDRSGSLRIGVGATLVRHSDPYAEVAETWAKAAGLLSAMEVEAPTLGRGADTAPDSRGHACEKRLADHPDVRSALESRNDALAPYWLGRAVAQERPRLRGMRALVIDAEDTFTDMLGHQLRALGLTVSIRPHDRVAAANHFDGADLVVVGPGPGDPTDRTDPRIATLRDTTHWLLHGNVPFVSECLGHQVLASLLGLPVTRKRTPNQGVQLPIDLFGSSEWVGFYNTFAAHSARDRLYSGEVDTVEIDRDPHTGEVHALHGPGFASAQFHLESVLTKHGTEVLGDLVTSALAHTAPSQERAGVLRRSAVGRYASPRST